MDRQTLRETFRDDPGDAAAYDALTEDLFFRQEWEELCAVHARRARALDDPEEAARAWLQRASVQEKRMGDPEAALDGLLEAAEGCPSPALLDDLERRLRDRDAPERRARVLERRADLEETPADAVEPLLEAARLRAGQDDVDAAIEALEKASRKDPADPRPVDRAVELLEDRGRFERAVDLLEERAGTTDETGERRRRLLGAARLATGGLADPDRAARLYRELLELDPPDEERSEAESFFADQGLLGDLLEALEARAAAHPSDAAEVWTRIARIHWERLERASPAIQAFAEALDAGGDLDLVDEALAIGREADDPAGEIAIIRRALDRLDEDDPARVDLLERLASAAGATGDPGTAIRALEEAVERDPDRAGVARRLVEVRRELDDPAALAGALERLRAATDDPAERSTVERELAEIRGDRLGQPEAALEVLDDLLEREPDDAGARRLLGRLLPALERAYRSAGRLEDLRALLERAARHLVDRSKRARALVARAELCLEELADPDEAEACYRELREIDPTHPDLIPSLTRLYEKEKRWDDLVDLLEAEAARRTDPDERREILSRLGRVAAERTDEPDRAKEAWRAVVRSDPTDREALLALEDLLVPDEEELPELEETWNRLVETASDRADRVRVRTRAAIALEAAGHPEKALEHHEAVLDEVPDHRASLQAARRLQTEAGRWEEVARLVEREARTIPFGRDRARLLREKARVEEEELDDPAAAAETREAILAIDPTDDETAERLADHRRETGDLDGLAELLERRIEGAEGPEATRLRSRLARLHVDRDRPAEAAAVLEGILALHPRDREALDALIDLRRDIGPPAKLARLLARRSPLREEPDDRAADLAEGARLRVEEGDLAGAERTAEAVLRLDPLPSEDHRLEALDLLESVARERDDHADLLAVLRRRLPFLDPAPRMDLLLEIADLEAEAGRLEVAEATLGQVLERDPSSRRAVERLLEVREEADDAAGQADALRRLLPLAEDDDERADIHRRLLELARGPLDDPDLARVALERLIALGEAGEDRLAELGRLHARFGDLDRTVELLDRRIEEASSADARADLLLEKAGILEGPLDRPAEAREALEDALAERPEDGRFAEESEDRALRLLARLQERLGDPDGRRATLDRRADRCEGEEGAVHRTRAARLALDQDEPGPARDRARKALEADPASVPARSVLLEALRRLEAWEELVEATVDRAEHARDDEDRAALLASAAGTARDRLDDPDRARELFREAVSLDPEQLLARQGLVDLAREAGDVEHLATALEGLLETLPDPASRAAAARRLGALAVEKGDVREAVRRYGRATREDPEDHLALRRLAELYERVMDAEGRREALRGLARLEPDAAERTRARTELAGLEAEAGAWEEAAGHLEAALADAPDRPDLLADLAEALERAEGSDPGELGDVLARLADAAPDATGRMDAWRRLARLRLEERDDPEGALEALDALAEEGEPGPRALDLREAALEEAGRAEELARLIRRRAAGSALAPTEAAERLTRAATVLEEDLDRTADALRLYREALDRLPLHRPALEGMARTAGAIGDRSARRQALEGLVRTRRGESRRALLLEMALLADTAGEPGAAIRHLRTVLDEVPDHPDALADLLRVARKADDAAVLAEALERALEAETDRSARADLLHERAVLLDERLGRPDRARRCLEEAIELVPDHPEAFDRLEALYRRQGAVDGLMALHADAARRSSAPEEVRAHRVAMARAARTPAEAADLLSRALEEGGDDPAILDEVIALRRQIGDRTGLASALARRESTAGPERRTAIQRELAEVLCRLGRFGDALTVLQRLVAGTPDDPRARERLAEVAGWLGRDEERVRALEEAAERYDEDERRADLLAEAARTLEGRLLDPHRAFDLHLEAFRATRDREEAARALCRLAPSIGRTADLVPVLEARLEAGPSGEEEEVDLLRLLLRARREAGDEEGAREAGRRLEELRPDDPEARRTLRELDEEAGRWEAAAGRLEDEARSGDGSDRREAWLELGALRDARLDDPVGAIEAYREALRPDGDEEPILERLAAVLRRVNEPELLRELGPRAAAALDDHAAADLLADAGEAARDAYDREEAREHFEAALGRVPDHPAALEALAELAADRGEWSRAAQLREQHAAAVRGTDAEAETLTRLASLRQDHLEDLRGAADALERAATVRPSDAEIRWALADLHEERDDPEAVRAVLADLALLPGPGEAERLVAYCRQAKALLRLDRRDDAIVCLRQALELDRTDRWVARKLADLLHEVGLEEEALPLDEWLATGDDDPELLSRLGRGAFRRGRAADAVRWLEEALARREDREDRALLADALLRADEPGRAAAEWRRLAQAAEGDARARALVGLGDAALQAGDATRAEDAYREALETGGARSEVTARLADILARREAREEEAATIRDRLEEEVVPRTERARLLVRLGRIRHRHLGTPGKAESAYLEASEIAEEESLLREALEGLAAVRETLGDAAGLRPVLERLVELRDEEAPDEADRHRLRLARLLAEVGDETRRAIELLEAILDRTPSHGEARALLARLQIEGPDPERAVREYRAFLSRDPTKVEALRGLARAAAGADDPGSARWAIEVLRFLGGLDATTAELDESLGPPPSDPRGRRVETDDLLEAVGETPSVPEAWDLLRAVAPWAPRVLPDAVGGSSSDEPLDPSRVPGLEDLVSFYGVDPGIRPAPEGRTVRVRPGDPPTLLLTPEALGRLEGPVRTALLAVHVAAVALDHVLVRSLEPAELEGLLLVFCKLDRSDVSAGRGEQWLGLLTLKRLGWALERSDRERIDEAAAAFLRVREAFDPARMVDEARRAEARAALVGTGDLEAVLEALAVEEPALEGLREASPAERVRAVQDHRVAGELLSFAVSEDHVELRRTIGFA